MEIKVSSSDWANELYQRKLEIERHLSALCAALEHAHAHGFVVNEVIVKRDDNNFRRPWLWNLNFEPIKGLWK